MRKQRFKDSNTMIRMKANKIILFCLIADCAIRSFSGGLPFETNMLHFGTATEFQVALLDMRSEWESSPLDFSACTNAISGIFSFCEQETSEPELAWQNAKRSLFLYVSISNELESVMVSTGVNTNGHFRTNRYEARSRPQEEVSAARRFNHYCRLYLLHRLITLDESKLGAAGEILLDYVFQKWIGMDCGTESGKHELRHVCEDRLDVQSLLLWISSNPCFSDAVRHRAKLIRKKWLEIHPEQIPPDEMNHPERSPDIDFSSNVLSTETPFKRKRNRPDRTHQKRKQVSVSP